MNIDKVIDRLKASDNLRNFTILSDVSVSIPAYGINIERVSESTVSGGYIVTEYRWDATSGEYGVSNQYELDAGELFDQIEDWDATLG